MKRNKRSCIIFSGDFFFFYIFSSYIIYGTHLVDVLVFLRVGEHVECRVELVEHPDDLHGAFRVRVTRTVVAEADYTGKQQRDALESFRRHRPFVPQLRGHADRQHGIQQSETDDPVFFRSVIYFPPNVQVQYLLS